MAIRTYTNTTSDVNINAVMDAIRSDYPQFWVLDANSPFGEDYLTDVSVQYDGTTLSITIDDSVTNGELDTIVASNGAIVESVSEIAENNRAILIDNARARFQTEIEADTPDWVDLYTDVQTALSNRPNVLSRMQNMSDLIARALGIADLSLVSAGQRNAIRLLAVILVLVLYK